VLERYKAESSDVHTRPDLAFPVALGERSVPGGPVLLVALILAICGYGTWYYLSTDERSRPERVAAVPPSLQISPPPGTAGADAAPPTAAAKPGAADSGAVNADIPNAGTAATPRFSSGLFPAPGAASPADTAGAATATPVAPASPTAAPSAASATSTPAGPASPASAGTARAAPPQQAAAATPQASPAEAKPAS